MLHARIIAKGGAASGRFAAGTFGPGAPLSIFMDLSIVIPVRNEAENIAPLVAEIGAALDGLAEYEILYVDDGSTDATAGEIMRLAADTPRLRLLRHARSCGQSAAIRSGVRAARAPWIATLDGDGQNDPADIPGLWGLARDASATPLLMVAGCRRDRRDRWSKRAASRIANAVRERLLGDDTPDTGCGLKLFPRALFLDLPDFDHMHRFLPALVLRAGGTVRSVPVNHRPRQGGVSKYGIFDRLGVGIVDLLGVLWLQRRAARPQLFGEMVVQPKAAEPIVLPEAAVSVPR
jgi:dolichol-phosphate mannosyltransferase